MFLRSTSGLGSPMLCSKMLLNSPPVKFLLWGFQGPQPLATIPTAARLSTMRFRHFICMDSASGWHPRSDSLVFSLLEGVNKDQSPHQGEHSPTVLGNILTQAKGLLVPLCPCPREFLHSLDRSVPPLAEPPGVPAVPQVTQPGKPSYSAEPCLPRIRIIARAGEEHRPGGQAGSGSNISKYIVYLFVF